MDPSTISITQEHKNELLDAVTISGSLALSFLSSMALKCALELEIADTINKHGEPMTLEDLANSLPQLNPNKASSLSRLIRLLVHSKFLSKTKLVSGEDVFGLTINSKLFLKDHPLTLAPLALAMLQPTMTEPAHHLSTWFQNNDVSPFHTAHGKGLFEYASSVPKFNETFNQAMASDARFVSSILLSNDEFKGLFEGLGSLVDVAGGTGTLANDIAKAYPGLKCTVLDLPHVVQGLQKDVTGLVEYVGGDMFQAVPPADAVLLKAILHDWSDDDCIKILKKCKEAISSRDQRGKVIIIDIVVDTESGNIEKESAQLLPDMQMLCLTTGGKERTEEEWNQLFIKAGYSTYKIFPILGPRSVIEVYPA